MKRYNVSGSNATGTANKTLINLVGGSTVRPALYDLTLGCVATPGDQAIQFQVARTTAAGTAGSSPVPALLDPGDVAAITAAGITHSAEPTYASTPLLQVSMNQRGTYRWVAQPGGELIGSATSANGIGTKLLAATASLICDGTTHFME
ncbi:MAG: hypothetical protein K2X82_08250 [Gemmataceae bacterium]|nr:hypothetical protein [Gemmataceae bacterium]